MIRGYVSSDEDDFDDYDFGYSEPLVIKSPKPNPLPEIRNLTFKEKLTAAVEESELIKLFNDAVDEGNLESIRDLISHGVSVDCSGPQEWTPLMRACVNGKVEVVEFLLQNGSDPNKHKELFTPLMACCTHTLEEEDLKLSCVRLLLQHGVNVNAKDKYGTTALMYATESTYVDIVTELLAVPDINVNIQDREGWTALFYAVNLNNLELVEKLFAAKSDLELKDRHGRTPVALALYKDLKNIAKVLGYVEEAYSDSPPKEVQINALYLDELPGPDGQGGFYLDAENFLATFKKTNLKKISLPDLLNATEKDLYNIGVKLRPDRLKILSKGIHRFHLQSWKKSSMHLLQEGTPLSLENIIAITGTIARHLTIANATLRYLNTRISTMQCKTQEDSDLEKEMVLVLVNSYNVVEKMKVLLQKILKHAQRVDPGIPADYIYPQVARETESRKKMKFLLYVVGVAATAGIFAGYCKNSFNFTTSFST